jgi:hypothetical protein
MWMFILSLAPYMVMGQVMSSLNLEMSQWQWWTLWGCMIATDVISYIKCKLED